MKGISETYQLCKVPLIKLQKSWVFKFHFLLTLFLTNVFGEDLSRPPAGKIYFK